MGWKVVAKIGNMADRSLMIGDSLCDLQTARGIGLNACVVSWGAAPFDRFLG